jgi:2-oxoglutarate ferredoxin oxidoreductase subunit alpha
VIDAEAQNKLVKRLIDKIRVHAEEIVDYEARDLEEAEVVVVSYGISARISMRAIELARAEGIKVGQFRLITAWPFPERAIRELSHRVKGFVVPELNFGQMCYEVERCACGRAPVVLVPHGGGEVHDPEEILEAIRSVGR